MDVKNMIALLLNTLNMDDKEVVIRTGRSGGEEYTKFVFVYHEDKVVIEAYKES